MGSLAEDPKGLIPPMMLTLKDVAERWHLSPSTVRRYVAEGELPVIRFKGALRFRNEDLDAFERRHASGIDR